ncbi:MAG: ATP-grasp fold amidoligase family protein [Verrucomicrobia bacterium]|nr:ATP-grasp fold amidoligase family protein [Verrucomicrobiota bacterium]
MSASRFIHRLKHSWVKRFGTDRQFIELNFRDEAGNPPDLDNPRTFNEKLQWYKLHYRNPLMQQATDKCAARDFVTQRGLGHILNNLLGVYDRADQIDFAALPAAFVLKVTHGSGMNIICPDKAALDQPACRQQLDRWLQTDFYRPGREWSYKNIPRKIVCEQYLKNEEYGELIDYKFYCFGGQPHIIFVCSERFSADGVKHQCFDPDWQALPVLKGRPGPARLIPRPREFAELLAVTKTLAAGFPFVRVDLYLVESRVVFGEMTFYPESGRNSFTPPEYNQIYGDLFVLPPKS